jgi:methylenetetrahydrofolate dehydrogenase (NADP+)/methenyltetrahydrofolate cyclohydrolase
LFADIVFLEFFLSLAMSQNASVKLAKFLGLYFLLFARTFSGALLTAFRFRSFSMPKQYSSPHPAARCALLRLSLGAHMSKILDGVAIAATIKQEVAEDVRSLAAHGIRPGLAAVLVGSVPASQIYVRNKVQTCAELGLFSDLITLPDTATTEELLSLVASLNARQDIDGILVQLPLPPQVDARTVLDSISPDKDVDGLHPINAGRLQAGRPALAPCTPAGVIEILKRSNIPIAGARAAVVGRSDIVGKPVAMLLLAQNATVTICHSKTRDLSVVTREAEILVAAIGRPGFITPEMVAPGATLIDVGINRISTREEFDRYFAGDAKREAAFQKRGSVIVGDIHPRAFAQSAAYTPVPGGVGPLTIAMLMSNTVRAARLRRGI